MEIYFKKACPKNQRKQSSQGDQRTNANCPCQVTVFLRSLLRSHHLLEQGGGKSSTGNPTCWQWENRFWHNIYIYIYIWYKYNIIYNYKYTHNIYICIKMYIAWYIIIYMTNNWQNITNILLTFHCQGAITNLDHYLHPAHQGPLCDEKHASLQNTQIDISYMLLHHCKYFCLIFNTW